ncbi:hypothetical protein BSKO_02916 [Bryopsis sp. KO-2023]|nr:hypothetical protein BSKO_02916 [Bryopsis sp. KO-2023]
MRNVAAGYRSWQLAVIYVSILLLFVECAECRPSRNGRKAQQAADRPNFLILLADDLGFDDLSLRKGNPIVETPRIDAFAKQSVQFNNFYAHAACTPSRASLLTGQHYLKLGVWGVHAARDYMKLGVPTFGDIFSDAGYQTGLLGKWHNGKTKGYLPWDRGFDEACITQLYYYFGNEATCNGEPESWEGWTTERIADRVIDFLSEKKEQEGDPFLLYVPFMAPHVGQLTGSDGLAWRAPPELIEKYLNKGLGEEAAGYQAMVEFLDTQVGRILDSVDDLGLAENTVVMFLSDNGPTKRKISDKDWDAQNPTELPGQKGEVNENGIRVPMFVRQTGEFKPAVVGDAIVSLLDIVPTMMDIAGLPTKGMDLDGMSFLELLKNPASIDQKWWDERVMFDAWMPPQWARLKEAREKIPGWGNVDKEDLPVGSKNGQWMVRQGSKKLTIVDQVETLLEVGEQATEVSDKKLAKKLKKLLVDWWDEILENDASFTQPGFFVTEEENQIFAMGAYEFTDDVTIKTHSVEIDAKPGSYLRFRLNEVMAGEYKVRVKAWDDSKWTGSMKTTIVCGRKVATVESEAKGKVELRLGSLNVDFDGTDCGLEIRVLEGEGLAVIEWIKITREP